VGLRYLPLHVCRQRCLGGTTVSWTGRCRPLDPIDFEARTEVPHSGWPFGRAHLEPFYARAQGVLELGPMQYDLADGRRELLPLRTADVRTTLFQYSPPTDFARAYRAGLETAPNVRAWLHASVVEIETSSRGDRISRLRLAAPDGRRAFVSAKVYVLASGGIENARLMLLSNSHQRDGLGNQHDLVGRYFMEHPMVFLGPFRPSSRCPSMDLYEFSAGNEFDKPGHLVAGLSPSDELMRREGLLNASLGFVVRRPHQARPEYWSDGVTSLEHLVDAARRRDLPEGLARHLVNSLAGIVPIARSGWARLRGSNRPAPLVARLTFESAPNPQSRITLSSRRDALGLPTARLDWRLSEVDRRSAARFIEIARAAIQDSGLGDFDVYPKLSSPNGWPLSIWGPHHHMGTTRMHVDPRLGVVDQHCRVHGLDNLYVAGSSVFPTSGYANPTLTIVALALRLADHLKAQLGGTQAAPTGSTGIHEG
jgi:choline dehydrogenase-like flavoprotein